MAAPDEHENKAPPESYKDELKEVFTELDFTASQKIDVANLRQLLIKLGYKLKQAEIDKIQQHLDPNSTGFIEYDAYIDYFMHRDYEYVDNLTNDELRCFDERDKSKAGLINVEYFKHVMTRLGQRMDEEDVDKILSQLKIENGYFKQRDLANLLNMRK